MSPRKLNVAIRRLREARGMNQRELAKKARVTAGYIALLELGQRRPSLGVLGRLAKALGVPVTELLG